MPRLEPLAAAAFIVAAAYLPGAFAPAFMPRWWAIAILIPVVSACDPRALDPRALVLLVLGIAWAAVTLLWAPVPAEGALDVYLMATLGLAVLAAAGCRDLEKVLAGFGWGVAVSSAICVAAFLGFPTNVQNSGFGGLFLSTEIMAETAAPILAWALWQRRWGLALAMAAPLLFCGSRIGPVAALAGLLAAWRPEHRWLRPALLTALLLAAAGLLFAVGLPKAGSALSRVLLWGAAALSLTPAGLGAGWWSVAHPDPYQEYVHSDPLELGVEFGLGALFLVGIPLLALARLWGATELRHRATLACLTALCFVSAVSFPMRMPATAFLGAILVGHALRRDRVDVEKPDWLVGWRSAWIALAILFATQNYVADRRFNAMFTGEPRPAEEWFLGSLRSLETFPYQRHLRRAAIGVMRVSGERILESQQ